MTARTVLTPVQQVADGGVALGAGTAIAGLVTPGATVDPGPKGMKIQVANSDSGGPHNVTVRAGGNGVTASGGTNPGVPFEAATKGDLVVAVPASSTQVITLSESARFTQADGSLSIDFAAGFTGTVWVLAAPLTGVTRNN